MTSSVPMSSSSGSSETQLILDEVNRYRRNHAAADLVRHAGLDRIAQQHCEYLRKNRGTFELYGKNVSHNGFEGRALIARENYSMPNFSENIASAKPTGGNPGPLIVGMWAKSPNHEFTMRSAWTHTGIGMVVDDDGTLFITQTFGTPLMTQMSSTDRFRRF